MKEKLSALLISTKNKIHGYKTKTVGLINQFTAKEAAVTFLEQTKIYEQILIGMNNELEQLRSEIEKLKRSNKVIKVILTLISVVLIFGLISRI